jgi:hypothetical protein
MNWNEQYLQAQQFAWYPGLEKNSLNAPPNREPSEAGIGKPGVRVFL